MIELRRFGTASRYWQRYRVYYGKHGQTLVILLCGGDKSSQQTDITHAKAYWTDWKRRNS
jgi:putative addiction module killer protein